MGCAVERMSRPSWPPPIPRGPLPETKQRQGNTETLPCNCRFGGHRSLSQLPSDRFGWMIKPKPKLDCSMILQERQPYFIQVRRFSPNLHLENRRGRLRSQQLACMATYPQKTFTARGQPVSLLESVLNLSIQRASAGGESSGLA